jgi:hypothetical protein
MFMLYSTIPICLNWSAMFLLYSKIPTGLTRSALFMMCITRSRPREEYFRNYKVDVSQISELSHAAHPPPKKNRFPGDSAPNAVAYLLT